MQIHSEQGKGTNFVISIPLKINSGHNADDLVKQPLNSVKMKDYQQNYSNVKVLFVDDMKYNLTIIKGILERNSFQVYTATNGLEALNVLRVSLQDLNNRNFHQTILTLSSRI